MQPFFDAEDTEGFLNPIQDGGSKRPSFTSFSSVTFTNVGINP